MIIFGAGSFSKIIFLLFKNNFRIRKKRIIIDSFSKLNFESKQFWLKNNFQIVDKINSIEDKKQPQYFVVGVGNDFGFERYQIINILKKQNYSIKSFHHESAFVDESVYVSDSAILMPKVTIMPLSRISAGCIINTSATIDHEVNIEKGCHIMGSSYIAGRVNIGKWSTIGANSTIFPDIKIGENCFIGAGSIVRKNVPDNSIVIGQPAKFLRRNRDLPEIVDILKRNNLDSIS